MGVRQAGDGVHPDEVRRNLLGLEVFRQLEALEHAIDERLQPLRAMADPFNAERRLARLFGE